MSEFVCVSYRDEIPENYQNRGNIPNLHQVQVGLLEHDLQLVLSEGAEVAYHDSFVATRSVDLDAEELGPTMDIELEEIGVILNRLNRSFKRDRLPEPHKMPATINENQTRSLAHRKHRAHTEVLEPLGLSMPTVLVESDADIDSFLAANAAPEIILKPNSGMNGQNIQRLARSAVYGAFASLEELQGNDGFVLQPAYDFTQPFPTTLRPFDQKSREAFEIGAQSASPKELRVYGFHSPAGISTFPVGRLVNNGDHWFFVDPQSVPGELLAGTADAMAKTAKASGAAAVYGTVDYGYGTDGTHTPDWRAIELNARLPYLISPDKHADVSRVVHNMLTDQLAATAR